MKEQHSNLLNLVFTYAIFTLAATFSNSSYAEGGLSLSQTRLVFNANEKNAKITIKNQSDRVYLVNSRVQLTPNANAKVNEALPLIMTPPLFRLEKKSQNTVLISKNDTSSLPVDRESIFYLSLLAIPSVKKNSTEKNSSDENTTSTQVSFGIRSVIKLFYRPSDLVMSPTAAPEKLTFKQSNSQLTVNNPTPYYVTLAQLTLNGKTLNVREQGAMISPFSAKTYHVNGTDKINHIQWSVINEFGGISDLMSCSK